MPRPSEILRVGGVDPVEACGRCGLADADIVEVRPAPRWMERLWARPVAAMTLPWAIYVRRRVLDGADARYLATLCLHELVHVAQWRRLGALRFLRTYLAGYLAGRRRGLSHDEAYRSIPLEAEARRIAGR